MENTRENKLSTVFLASTKYGGSQQVKILVGLSSKIYQKHFSLEKPHINSNHNKNQLNIPDWRADGNGARGRIS